MITWLQKPERRGDTVAYLITVSVALSASWRAEDLVWGLWVTGIVGTLATLVGPWLLLTAIPDLEGGRDPEVSRSTKAKDLFPSMVMLLVIWGTALAGYMMAAGLILGWIPLPREIGATNTFLSFFHAFRVCLNAYWAMVVVNVANQSWQVWRAIREGTGSPTNPLVVVGRVLVVCTVMAVLYLTQINSLAVVILLFLFYIPDDVFAERVLGME